MSNELLKAEPKNGIKAVDTMFSILDVLQDRNGAGVTEVANELGMSKSTVHNHLSTLRKNRYVTKNENTYEVDLRFMNLGGYARKQHGLFDLIKPEVDGLVEDTGETAQMVVEEHGRGIYLYQARGERAIKTDSYTGTEVYLHCTSVGKAILSCMSEKRVEEIVERHGLPQKTNRTVSSIDELSDELDRVRQQGYALDDGERIEGIRCIGVPVTSENGDLIGALSLSGPTSRMKGERFTEEIPELLNRVSRVIEITATYR